MLQDCVGTFVDAGSSDSLERIATHLRSFGIWCGRTALSMVWWTPITFHARGVAPFVIPSTCWGYRLRSAAGP